MKYSRKPKAASNKEVLASGEFRSRTNKHITQVSASALRIRTQGITKTRKALEVAHAAYEGASSESFEELRLVSKELISAMNFTVRDCEKELARRNKK